MNIEIKIKQDFNNDIHNSFNNIEEVQDFLKKV